MIQIQINQTEVECYDAWHTICGLLSALMGFSPIIAFLIAKYHKPLRLTVLEYHENRWYWGQVDILRRGILVILPSVTVWTRITISSFVLVTTIAILTLHCTVMPYRWRANNYLEAFVLC